MGICIANAQHARMAVIGASKPGSCFRYRFVHTDLEMGNKAQGHAKPSGALLPLCLQHRASEAI